MLELKLTGEEEIRKLIAGLPQKISKSAALESLVIATQPVVSAMKQTAPVDKGALRESIGFRLRRYRGGKTLFVAIGPRLGWFKGEKPSKTSHLIERGHYTRKGPKRRFIVPNAFMRRSWAQTKDKVLSLFKTEFGDRLIAEVVRRKTKRRKTK